MTGIVEIEHNYLTKLVAAKAAYEASCQEAREYQARYRMSMELARQMFVELIDCIMPATAGLRQCPE